MKNLPILLVLVTSINLLAVDAKNEMKLQGSEIHKFIEKIDIEKYDYDFNEVNKLIFNKYSDGVRTPIQSFILGNMLYSMNPSVSYRLHEEAYKNINDNSSVVMEWALELHRNKEYRKALDVYKEFISLNGDYAPIYGLMADCSVNTGNLFESLDFWEKSEKSQNGSVEKFEELLCSVKFIELPDVRRLSFMEKAKKGDVENLYKLLSLDAMFNTDWWNSHPNYLFLKSDYKLLTIVKNDEGIIAKSLCELLLLKGQGEDQEISKADAEKILVKCNFEIDNIFGIRANEWGLYSILMGYIFELDIISKKDYANKYIDSLVKTSKTVNNVELQNLILNVMNANDDQRYSEYCEEFFQKSKDERFSQGNLNQLLSDKKFKDINEILGNLIKQSPYNSNYWYIKWSVDNKFSKDDLEGAIKSEFNKLSLTAGGLDFPRPRARQLRIYYSQLKHFKE